MYLILIAALMLVGLAASSGLTMVASRRSTPVDRRRAIEMYGITATDEPEDEERATSGIATLAERLGTRTIGRLSPDAAAQLRRELLVAGIYDTSAASFLGYRLLVTAAAGGSLGFLAIAAPSPFTILSFVLGVALAWRVPSVVVQRRAKERLALVDRDLPELIDLLVVSVEAGMGLTAALQMTSSRMGGPLGVELRFMLKEQTMGLTNAQSLDKLLDRCDTTSVRSFVRSLQQGERLGVSIGGILRGLAGEMRLRRRQSAEERAQKAPVKILFPLIFLIFPALFVVLLGPALFTLKDALA
jgi:tight adherence protein C